MNEELQKKLVELINGAQKAGTEAFLFTKEQVPDVIQQLLRWKFAEALSVAAFCLALITLCFWVARWAWEAEGKSYMDEGHAFCFMLSLLTSLISIIFLWVNALTALQIYIAPKVYLLEYAATLIKK